MLNKNKLLVTGSSGFIGGHCVKYAQENNYDLELLPREHLYFPKDLKKSIDDFKPDYIINLAAYGNHYDQQDETQIVNANIVGLFNLLEATKDVPYKGFINISSSSVYGTKDCPMSEDMTLDTDTFYGASKVAGEYLVRAFVKKYQKPIVNVRPFSVYGENEADHRFIPTVIRAIKNKETIKLDPYPMHDWIYVKDFVDAVFSIMHKAEDIKGKAVNVGMGTQYSNKEILEKIEWVLNDKTEVEIVDSQRSYDANSWVSDITYLESLGIKPKTNIMRGLKNACSSFSQKN
jgi:nucleoside-diphosphate-sugar epimerase